MVMMMMSMFPFLPLYYRDDCDTKCRIKHGTWDSWRGQCTVITYLNSVCYRVNKVNDEWQLDQPP